MKFFYHCDLVVAFLVDVLDPVPKTFLDCKVPLGCQEEIFKGLGTFLIFNLNGFLRVGNCDSGVEGFWCSILDSIQH